MSFICCLSQKYVLSKQKGSTLVYLCLLADVSFAIFMKFQKKKKNGEFSHSFLDFIVNSVCFIMWMQKVFSIMSHFNVRITLSMSISKAQTCPKTVHGVIVRLLSIPEACPLCLGGVSLSGGYCMCFGGTFESTTLDVFSIAWINIFSHLCLTFEEFV